MALLDKLAAAFHAPVRGVRAAPSEYLASDTELKALLARRIAPEMEAEGCTYDGQYTWYGPWEGHSRRVVGRGTSREPASASSGDGALTSCLY